MALNVGKKVKNFTLKDQNGDDVSLDSFKEKNQLNLVICICMMNC